ncbi:hypothetical protein [Gimesia maris]|uniref:hypothetical protein n=1 Tax=Gimesia maris TaxID=122 RepID=UPI0036F1C1F3
MSAIVGPLEFDDHQVGILIHAQKIDPPTPFGPLPELLGNHQRVRRNHLHLHPQQPLQIIPLLHPRFGVRGLFQLPQGIRRDFINGHGVSSVQLT